MSLGVTGVEYTDDSPFQSLTGSKRYGISLDSTVRDTRNTPTTNIGAGFVVGEKTGASGVFVAADSPDVKQAVAASIESESYDAAWTDEVLTIVDTKGRKIEVTLSAAANAAAVVGVLLADPEFAALYNAEVTDTDKVTITALFTNIGFEVSIANNPTAFATGVNDPTNLPNYAITVPYQVSVVGINTATRVLPGVDCLFAGGIVIESKLANLTAAAKAFLESNGVVFL